MKRLAAIVYSTNNPVLTELAVKHLRRTVDPALTEIVVIDNGSDEPFPAWGDRNIRYTENVGGNAVFHRCFRDGWWIQDPVARGWWASATGTRLPNHVPEFLAFFHCDLMIHEPQWDARVIDAFDRRPNLSLLGFVGSNEIDNLGGRGAGTMLNYAGRYFEGIGQASPGHYHGRVEQGFAAAAVLDHCSMIFRSSVLKELTPQEGTYAPEHFYDRILSCEVIDRGEWVGVLGVSCDHFSGGIGPGIPAADRLRRAWLDREGVPYDPRDTYTAVYKESELRFFRKYMNTGFAPFKVKPDHSVVRGNQA